MKRSNLVRVAGYNGLFAIRKSADQLARLCGRTPKHCWVIIHLPSERAIRVHGDRTAALARLRVLWPLLTPRQWRTTNGDKLGDKLLAAMRNGGAGE